MRKHTAVKWNKELAASEFNINSRTLSGRLRRHGITPDAKGEFTTRQICTAVFGDIDGEKLRLTTEQADRLALENQASRGELVDLNLVAQFVGKFFTAARQRILSNLKLDDDEKDKILRELQGCVDLAGWDGNPVDGAKSRAQSQMEA